MRKVGMEWQVIDTPIQLQEVSSISTPLANKLKLYAKDSSGVSTLAYKNDAGTEMVLPTSGSFVTGSGDGVSGRVAFFNGATTLGHEAELFYDTANNRLGVGTSSPQTAINSVGRIQANMDTGSAGFVAHATSNLSVSDTIRMIGGNVDGVQGNIAGDVRLEKTSAGHAVSMEFFCYDGSTFAERMRIDSAGLLSIGGFAPDFRLSIRGSTNATGNIAYRYAAADATGPGLSLNKFRGSFGSEAATQADDLLGTINFGGWTDAEKFNACRVEARAATLWTSTNSDTYLLFQTTPTGSVTRAERFRIGPSGQWGIGGATYGGSGDIFSSGGASAAPTWVTRATLNAALDHGTLAGLTDDDHAGYARLAGRAGSANNLLLSTSTTGSLTGSSASGGDLQLYSSSNFTTGKIRFGGQDYFDEANLKWIMTSGVYGSAGSGNNLTIGSTTHATKGKIIFGSASVYDEVNDRIGIGQTSPSRDLHITSDGANSDRFLLLECTGNSQNSGVVLFQKTVGSAGGAVLDQDGISAFAGVGYDGTSISGNALNLRCLADGNWSGTNHGTLFEFRGTSNGSTTLTTWLTLRQGNVIAGNQAALATTDTDGFLHIPSCAGTPTGTPTAYTGKVPIIYDTSNNKLYAYNGAWKSVTLA